MHKTLITKSLKAFLLAVSLTAGHAYPQIMGTDDLYRPVTVGIPDNLPTGLRSVLDLTFRQLSKEAPEFAVVPRIKPLPEIAKLLETNKVDFALLPASSYAALEAFRGIKAVAFLKHPQTLSGDRSGTLTAVTLPTKNITKLKDILKLKVGVTDDEARFHLPLLIGELSIQQGKPVSFKDIQFLTKGTLLQELDSGKIDVGIVPPCSLEEEIKEKKVQVIEPRVLDKFECKHSSSLLPGWIIASSLHTPPETADEMSALLKTLFIPSEYGNYRWDSPKSIKEVHRLLEFADDKEYFSYVRESLGEFVKRNSIVFLCLFIALLTLALHGWLAERLVKKKTCELMEAAKEKEQIFQDFQNLEKLSIVGQMSSIFAHEIKQPLTAIKNYSAGLMRRSAKGSLDAETMSNSLSIILSQTERIQKVVDHVRAYARGQLHDSELFNLSAAVEKTVERFLKSAGAPLRLDKNIEKDVLFEGDAFEFETVLLNLLKNSKEAMEGLSEKTIRVTLTKGDKEILLRVENSGQPLSDEELEQLGTAFRSTKAHGLGLGLGIVCRITESHGGRTVFANSSLGGLSVSLIYPNSVENK